MTAQQEQDINNRFTYHPPKGDQMERYAEMREMVRVLAIHIASNTQFSREQSLALTYLDQVMFAANAAIARNE